MADKLGLPINSEKTKQINLKPQKSRQTQSQPGRAFHLFGSVLENGSLTEKNTI